jgi:hypothetical protein
MNWAIGSSGFSAAGASLRSRSPTRRSPAPSCTTHTVRLVRSVVVGVEDELERQDIDLRPAVAFAAAVATDCGSLPSRTMSSSIVRRPGETRVVRNASGLSTAARLELEQQAVAPALAKAAAPGDRPGAAVRVVALPAAARGRPRTARVIDMLPVPARGNSPAMSAPLRS